MAAIPPDSSRIWSCATLLDGLTQVVGDASLVPMDGTDTIDEDLAKLEREIQDRYLEIKRWS